MSKIKELFQKAGIEPVILEEIETAFQAQVDARTEERVALAVESAMKIKEEEYKKIFKEGVDTIEAAHAKALADFEAEAVAGVNQLNKLHESQLTKLAVEHRDELELLTSDFLEAKLDEVIPTSVLEDVARNKEAIRLLEQVRDVVGFDSSIIRGNVRKALEEGERTITSLEEQVATLTKRAALLETIALIEAKTSSMPADKKAHIKSVLGSKSPAFIKENFDEVASLYDKSVTRAKSSAAQDLTQRRRRTPQVDRPLISESVTDEQQQQVVVESSNEDPNGYLAALKSHE